MYQVSGMIPIQIHLICSSTILDMCTAIIYPMSRYYLLRIDYIIYVFSLNVHSVLQSNNKRYSK